MSDINLTEDDDAEEEISEEEKTVVENTSFQSLGINPTDSLDNLLKQYRENHDFVTAFTKTQKAGKADPTDVGNVIKNNLDAVIKSTDPAQVDKRNAIQSAVEKSTSFVFGAPHTLLTSSILLQELEHLTSLVKAEVRYHFDNAVQEEKNRLGIKSTPSETAVHSRLICEKLRLLIENRVNYYNLTGETDQIPAGLVKPEVPGKKGGFNTDLFPKRPRLDVEGSASISGTASTHLVFRWFPIGTQDETSVPDGLTLRQVAHDFVSSGAYRITGQEVEKELSKLKPEGSAIGATKEYWSLTFRTGVLQGRKA